MTREAGQGAGGRGGIGSRRLRDRAVRRPLVQIVSGVLLLVVIAWGPSFYGRLTAGSRLDPSLTRGGGPVNVEITMAFEPQGFHMQTLQNEGVFAGRVGTHGVRLFNVSQAFLRALSRMYWISAIRPVSR